MKSNAMHLINLIHFQELVKSTNEHNNLSS